MTVSTKRAVRQTQAERSDTSQRRLLAAAAELIATEGLAATSLERVGVLGGYSRGLVSANFGSKQGLLRAVVDLLAARVEERLSQNRSEARSPMEEIHSFADILLTGVRDDRSLQAYWIMLMATMGNRDPLQEDFTEIHRRFRGKLVDMIRRGQKEGFIDASLDADAAGVVIGGILLGASVQIMLDASLKFQPIYDTAQTMITRALGADSS